MNRSDYIAHKQQHPKKPIIGWQVKIRGEIYYENKDNTTLLALPQNP